MISTQERSDIIHIMKTNRLSLLDLDSVLMSFGGQAGDSDYRISIFTLEDLPRICIKRDDEALFNDTVRERRRPEDISRRTTL